MAYIPGARWRGGSYTKSGSAFASRREYREGPRVDFGRSELVKSEGLSRELAQSIVDAFRRSGLAVHPYQPVRDKIIRKSRSWVPAVCATTPFRHRCWWRSAPWRTARTAARFRPRGFASRWRRRSSRGFSRTTATGKRPWSLPAASADPDRPGRPALARPARCAQSPIASFERDDVADLEAQQTATYVGLVGDDSFLGSALPWPEHGDRSRFLAAAFGSQLDAAPGADLRGIDA